MFFPSLCKYPMVLILMWMSAKWQRHQATVTVVHSKTPNPAEFTKRADIIIAAVGVAHLVRGDWIKPGAVIIDVGTNAIEVGFTLYGQYI